MIKIPDYIDFLTKFIFYFGLDYEAPSESPSKAESKEIEQSASKNGKVRGKILKNRIKEVKTYTIKAEKCTHYLNKKIKLFAGENQKKQEAVNAYLLMSENICKFLNSKNYYTIAENERVMWGLLVFYYIPYIACIISLHKKIFNKPNELNILSLLNDKNFMFPYKLNNNSNEIILSNKLLCKYLKKFKQIGDKVEEVQYEYLIDYLRRSDLEVEIPSYDKKRSILIDIENIKNKLETLDEKERTEKKLTDIHITKDDINEVNAIFYAAIVSANIYKDLSKKFSDSKVLELFEYFTACLKVCDAYLNDVLEDSPFNNYFKDYIVLYYYNFRYSLKMSNLKNNLPFEYYERSQSELIENEIFRQFNVYLLATKNNEKNKIDHINIQDLTDGVFSHIAPVGLEIIDKDLQNIVEILQNLHALFSSKTLVQKNIEESLFKLKNHKLYSDFKIEYLFYDVLNDLASDKLDSCLIKIKENEKFLTEKTNGEYTRILSKYYIILMVFKNKDITFRHLNPAINLLMESTQNEYNFIANLGETAEAIYDLDSINITELGLGISPGFIEFESSSLSDSMNGIIQESLIPSYFKIIDNDRLIKNQKINQLKENIKKRINILREKNNFKKNRIIHQYDPIMSQDKINKSNYLNCISELITQFNINGYSRYESGECIKINPYQKVDYFLGDFYGIYESLNFDSEIEGVRATLETLMLGSRAKYEIKKNLVVLYEFMPIDVFDPVNFINIFLFHYDCKIESKNIFKLANDYNKLILIYKCIWSLSTGNDVDTLLISMASKKERARLDRITRKWEKKKRRKERNLIGH